VFGHGLVEGRGDLHEGVVCGEGVGAGFGADDGDKAFGGDVVYYKAKVVSTSFSLKVLLVCIARISA
jgi:hypothetical protein